MNPRITVFGHRGARGLAPENTLPAFRLAKELGVDGVELDVHLTSDDELVVIHDDTLDRTTNGKGRVRDYTVDQIKKLDAGIKFGEKWRGVTVPTLRQVFEETGKLLYKVELKHGSAVYPGIESRLIDLVREMGVERRVRFTSFDYDALEEVRRLDPKAEVGIIYHGKTRWFLGAADKLGAAWMQAYIGLLDQKDVEMTHAIGLKIGAWPTSTIEDIEKAVALGTDEVTSDYPDVAVRYISEEAQRRVKNH